MNEHAKLILPYLCDALVDQDRKIGNDPVGYKCSRPAKYELDGRLVCEECKAMFLADHNRITFTEFYGYEHQHAVAKALAARMGLGK